MIWVKYSDHPISEIYFAKDPVPIFHAPVEVDLVAITPRLLVLFGISLQEIKNVRVPLVSPAIFLEFLVSGRNILCKWWIKYGGFHGVRLRQLKKTSSYKIIRSVEMLQINRVTLRKSGLLKWDKCSNKHKRLTVSANHSFATFNFKNQTGVPSQHSNFLGQLLSISPSTHRLKVVNISWSNTFKGRIVTGSLNFGFLAAGV